MDVLATAGLAIGVLGFAFGIYQWRAQRGQVFVVLHDLQRHLLLSVVVASPQPVAVNNILMRTEQMSRLSVVNRVRVFRLRRWVLALTKPQKKRTPNGAFLKMVGLQVQHLLPHGLIEDTSYEGDALPCQVPAYSTKEWSFDIAPFRSDFRRHSLDRRRPAVRMIVNLSGHLRRLAVSNPSC